MTMPDPRAAAADPSATAALDARFAHEGADRWSAFFTRRDARCPFFEVHPDENLRRWLQQGLLPIGPALDLGCGNGRNAIELARAGCDVLGVDFAASAIAWARENVRQAGMAVRLQQADVFALQVVPGSQALVYDSGCFHHLAPHRRADYVALVERALRPGGSFGLVCFRPEGGGGLTDEEAMARGTLAGGLGYDEGQLRAIWSGAFEIEDLQRMAEPAPGAGLFGKDFLWVMRARKR